MLLPNAPNATSTSAKRKHQTLPPNASTNGGDASRVGKMQCNAHTLNKGSQTANYTLVCEPLPYFPDARRVAPISGSA